MENRSIFLNLSPLDHRYYMANKALFDSLAESLSEEASIRYAVKTELALLKAHVRFQFPDKDQSRLLSALEGLEDKIDPAEVYAEEEKTQHNIRAMVNVLKKFIPEELNPYVHLGATSVDMLDTAQSLKVRDAVVKVILPLLADLELELCKLSAAEADTPQIGRTHGQYAVPITLGFALGEYVSRLGKSILKIRELAGDVKGKLAGAVGSYNATSVITKDPQGFEKAFLAELGLEPSEHSTQMVEPEYLLRLLLEINVAFGVLANLADDLRNLQRSEISEVREEFISTQVGSSTMPQKRNPWNSEHVKSLWKAFAPRVMTFFMDQISEHQRDLTNSASTRFIADYLAGFTAAVSRMKKVLTTLRVNKDRLMDNITKAGDMVLAEAVYIILSLAGDVEGHETVRKLTLTAEKEGTPLVKSLQSDAKLWKTLEDQLKKSTGWDAAQFFSHPELYHGLGPVKARDLSAKYKAAMEALKEELKK